jgi:hypothetical protein
VRRDRGNACVGGAGGGVDADDHRVRLSRKKKLRPGRYRLKVTATDPTTPKSSSRSASFRIVKG